MFRIRTVGIQKYSIEETVPQRMYGRGMPQTADAGPSAWLLQYGNDHSIENSS